jgi:hypothetical protein
MYRSKEERKRIRGSEGIRDSGEDTTQRAASGAVKSSLIKDYIKG